MPVTAKLSRKFYDRLGDDIANELVEWFNAVDSSYKSDLKEINELNWHRSRAEFRGELDTRFAAVDVRFADLRGELDTRFATVDIRFAELRAELIKWMFLFWVGTVVPLGGLMVALVQGK